MDLLFAARSALDPGHREPRRTELSLLKEEMGVLTTTLVQWTVAKFLDEHRYLYYVESTERIINCSAFAMCRAGSGCMAFRSGEA